MEKQSSKGKTLTEMTDIDKAIEDIINIAVQGRTEIEAVFILRCASREVDKYFDHSAEAHDIKPN